MTRLNRDYVLAPFHALIGRCQANVLIGLRLIEAADRFPAPSPEELRLFQISFSGHVHDLATSKNLFTKWILASGFEEIHKCIRTTLERLFVFRTIELKLGAGAKFDIGKEETKLRAKAGRLNHPDLTNKINSLFKESLRYRNHVDSFNNARNCLVHANGIVTKRYCNNPTKDKAIICGQRFTMFFQKGEERIPVHLGDRGPENSALMLGAEEFQIEFALDQPIELSLKQFVDVLNSCVFVRADIETRLPKMSP